MSKHSVPLYVGVIFSILLFGLLGLVHIFDGLLPTPLMIDDEKNYPNDFIAERASNYLKALTSIGPHPTGTYENEVLAVKFLLDELELISQNCSTNKKLEIELQVVSDGNFTRQPKVNLQNVVVKLHSENGDCNSSLLVNAHFDSAPGSPGGSDDGINCAVMLEILRKLCTSPETFQHNIIFLFNGAEEVGMLASGAFIRHHRWFKEVKAFVNLEANGSGGKIVLFQTGPGQAWLLNYYKRVPYPHATAFGEELFQSGLIRTDTDYRIFVQDGGVAGLDLAFIKNSQRYHSKYDDHESIPLGSYQHVGANTLNLIKNLANASELAMAQEAQPGNMVFYDFFATFLIAYSETTGSIINVAVSVLSIGVAIGSLVIYRKMNNFSFVYVILSMGSVLLGWLLAIGCSVATAKVLDSLGYSMSWFANPWMVIGLYAVPAFASSCLFIELLKLYQGKLNPSIRAQIEAHCTRMLWTIVLLIGTILKIRSVYLFLIPVLFETIGFIAIHTICICKSVRKWQILYITTCIAPNLFLMQQALILVTFLIPQFGRMGIQHNPEIYVALITCFFTLLISSCYAPLITLTRKSYILLIVYFGIFFVFLGIVCTPLGFPYSSKSPAPQRFFSYQVTRRTYGFQNASFEEDVVYTVRGQDKNAQTTFDKYVKNFKADERAGLYDNCGNSRGGFCLLSVNPLLPEPVNLELTEEKQIGNETVRFTFSFTGSNHMDLYVSPTQTSSLISTNLGDLEYVEDGIFAIYYLFGKETNVSFSLDFQGKRLLREPLFSIELRKRYPYKRASIRNEYDELLETFPEWTNVVPFMVIVQNCTF